MKYNKNIIIKVLSTLVIFILFMSVLSSCGAEETANSKVNIEMKPIEGNRLYGYVLTTEHAKIIVEKDYLTESEMMDIAEKIEKGINDVKDYLGDEYCKYDFSAIERISYFIKSGEFISTGGSGVVTLAYVKEKRSPYIHETVHALALLNNTKWLQEGLAVYLNDHLGGDPTSPNRGKDIHKLSKEIIADDFFKDTLSFENRFAYIPPSAYIEKHKERRAFYTVSASLVKYIENKYGKEKLLRIYFSEDIKDIKNITGKSFEDIRNEWLEYMKNY